MKFSLTIATYIKKNMQPITLSFYRVRIKINYKHLVAEESNYQYQWNK